MKKKVLLISYRLGYDSLLYWDNILSAIKKEFNDFRVFTAWNTLSTKNQYVTTEEKLKGIKYYHRKNTIKQSLVFIPMPFFIIDIIKYKPDIIIINEFSLANFYTVFFKYFYKKTKILLLVESDPYLGNKIPVKKGGRFIYRKYILNNIDKILTNNNLGKKYLIDTFECSKVKIKQAPYLMSTPQKECEEKERKNNFIINFLYVGQLVERKGIIYLLQAMNSIPKEVKNKISLKIVGEGNLDSYLKEYKDKNKLDFIEFVGKVPFNKLCLYYKNADCFILPTLHDYRALVSFEALYFGCAIIDSKYNGSRFEVVEDGKNGYIVNPKNIEEFKNAIINISTDKSLLEGFKEISSIKKNYFKQEICNQNLINTLKEML